MDNLREEEISKHLNERNHLLTCCKPEFLSSFGGQQMVFRNVQGALFHPLKAYREKSINVLTKQSFNFIIQ